jgi:hypothetical protein
MGRRTGAGGIVRRAFTFLGTVVSCSTVVEVPSDVSIAFPFSLRAQVALRAKLAAFMVLAMLVTGLFNLRVAPTDANRTSGQAQSVFVLNNPLVRPRHPLASAGGGAQLAKGNRLRHAGRRSPRYEDSHQSAQAIVWPDIEKGAPTRPRFVFRKLPQSESADSDADSSDAPPSGYHPRAPPATA